MIWNPYSQRSLLRFLLTVFLLAVSNRLLALCGSVDYSKGAEALSDATHFMGTITMYVLDISYAVAAIVVVISALQIYVKMTYQEGEVLKNIMMLMGGVLFMIAASFVMPAFFGYQNLSFAY